MMVALLAFVAYVSPESVAATRTWDGGGSDSSWGTKNNWSNNTAPTGSDTVVFDADLAASKFSVSLGANRTILGLTFDTANVNNAFTISGNTLTVTSSGITNNDNLGQTISSAVTVSTAAQTFNAASGGLTFGAVTLLSNLTLSGNSAITLGNGGGALTNSGANRTLTINTGGNRTIGAINLSNNATSRTLTITGSGNATVTGVIANGGGSSAGNLTKSGNGTLTLSGANTYTGFTTVSQGTLRLGAANRLADASSLNVSGGTFDVQSFNDSVGAITLSSGTIAGTGTLTGSSYALQGGTVNANLGTGTATVTSGTTTLNGTLGSTTININSGALNLGSSNRLSDSAAVAVAGGSLNLGSFTDTIGAVTLSGTGSIDGTGTLTAATYLLHGGTVNANLGTGTAGVSTGTTTLNGSLGASTVNINSGTLTLGANDRISNSAAVNVAGGTLQLGAFNDTVGAFTLSSGSIAGTGTLSASSFNFTNTSSVTVSAGLGGSGTFTKSGTGDLILSGNNSFTTPVTVNAGTLVLAHNNALGAVGTWGNTIANGATLGLQGDITVSEGGFNLSTTGAIRNLSGNNTLGGQLTIGGANTIRSDAGTLTIAGAPQINTNTLTVTGAGNVTFTEAISGSGGGFSKTGTGTLTFSGTGANSFDNLAVNQGTVVLAKTSGVNAVGGNGTITIGDNNNIATPGVAILQLGASNQIPDYAGSFDIRSDGRFDLNNFNESINTVTGTGNIELGSGALTVGVNSSSSTFGGTITGSGSLTKSGGGGTFTLTGSNSYTGGTTVAAGILQFGANNVLADSGVINITGGTLDVGGFNDTVGALSLSAGAITGTGTLTASSLDFTNGSATSVSAVLGGSAGLTKSGGGTLTLSGANTFSGSTVISGGSIAVTNSLALQNSTLDYNNQGGSLSFSALTSATLGGLTGAQNLALTNNSSQGVALTVGGNNSSTSYSGALSGAGGLTKSGTGTLTLSGANTYTGSTTINNGTLQLDGTNRLTNPDIVVNATNPGTTATFALASSATQTINSLTFGGTGATSTSTNNVSLGSGSTLTLGGNVTYLATNNPLGSTISGAGTLALGSGQRTFNIGNSSNATTDLAISSNITGTGSLLKTGAGTLALSGSNNTFSGGVIVDQGTLLAVGTTSEGGFKALGNYNSVVVPTTVVTVNDGATLAVQNTSFAPPATQTTQLLNISLSGTGADGGGALQNLGGLNTWLGNISLAGNTTIQNHLGGNNNTLFLGPYVQISPTAVELNNNALTFIGAGDVYISSALGKSTGDTGSLNINLTNGGYGTGVNSITLAGPQNFYTGATTVNNGWLRMLVDAGNHPNAGILGSLTIGDGIGGANTAVVSNYYIEQIADNAAVTIKSDGLLDLASGSVNETLSNITLQGGRIATGTGNLYMTGTIAAKTAGTSTIDGNIGMQNSGGGPARIFSVDSGSTLLVNAKLFGGDYNKTGDGRMIVTSDSLSSGYNGLTTVQGGTLTLRHSGALGQHTVGAASSGTVVQNGATLQLDGTNSNLGIQYEALTLAGSGYNNQGALNSLAGSNTWNNATITLSDSATINTDDGTLSIGGRIGSTAGAGQTQTLTVTGSGNTNITGSIKDNIGPSPTYTDLHTGTLALNKTGSGTLTLSGLNTFTGAINVNQGTLAVTANNSLGAQTNAVTVQSGATFALSGGNNYTNTIGRLEGTGVVSIASATVLKVNNTTANTFDGRLSGQGLFDKVGAGTFTFSSTANTDAFNFDGTVRLSNGTLEFAGGSGVLNTSTDALFINTLELTGGTLLLSEAFINVGTLNITGDTILDFGATGHSILNATNIYIAAGKTLLIRNWTSEVDFLFANADFRQNNGSGTIALFNQIGTQPENQVHFEGDPQSPDGSHTTWINYGYDGFTNWEIRPIPEPSTYGAILTASSLAFLLYRRSRKAKSKS